MPRYIGWRTRRWIPPVTNGASAKMSSPIPYARPSDHMPVAPNAPAAIASATPASCNPVGIGI